MDPVTVAQERNSPFANLLGIHFIKAGPDGVTAELTVREDLFTTPAIGHGGMLMAFADEALGRAAWVANGGRRQVTVQLDTHFIAGAAAGDFIEAECRIVRQTRSLLFMAATLAVGDRIVATSNGVWKILSG